MYGSYPMQLGMGRPDPTQAQEYRADRDAETREQVAQTQANVQEEAAARRAGDIRGTGTLTKFRPWMGWANERGPNLAQGASEVGSPESFNGGAGAPTPIGVIRGMRQTFATDTGGPQLSEYATPLQAMQGSNQAGLRDATAAANNLTGDAKDVALANAADKYGEFQGAPTTPKDNLVQAQADLTNTQNDAAEQTLAQTKATQERATFQQQALPLLGVQKLDELKKDPDKFNLFTQHLALAGGKGGAAAALKGLQDTLNYKRWDSLFTPDNVQGVHDMLAAQGVQLPPVNQQMLASTDPEIRKKLVNSYGPYLDTLNQQRRGAGILSNLGKNLTTGSAPFVTP
jgi:hypothetical protein